MDADDENVDADDENVDADDEDEDDEDVNADDVESDGDCDCDIDFLTSAERIILRCIGGLSRAENDVSDDEE